MKKNLKQKMMIVAIAGSFAVGSFAGITSLETAEAKSPQSNKKVENVIFMIPDGYSSSYATNYRLYKGEESVMDPHLVGMHRTYSANCGSDGFRCGWNCDGDWNENKQRRN